MVIGELNPRVLRIFKKTEIVSDRLFGIYGIVGNLN